MMREKELLIKYIEAGDPDEEGIRTLTFQVNGSLRHVKIQDKSLKVNSDRRLKADKAILSIWVPLFRAQSARYLSKKAIR